MPSNLPAIVDGIVATVAAIPGIDQSVGYEPEYYSGTMFCLVLDDFVSLQEASGEMSNGWNLAGRLVVPFTNNEGAEAQLYTLVPAIIEAAGQDMDAQGTIVDGQWLITAGKKRPLRKGNTIFLVVDFRIQITERIPFTWSL